MTHLGKAGAFVLALTLLVRGAGAQGRDAAAADALFREARALMKQGKFPAACPKLEESLRLDPAAGTAINLADCREETGKLADALQSYRDALDMLRPGDSRIARVKEQIDVLDKRVPRLTINLAPGAPAGTKIRRDDVELGKGSLNVALPVNPGPHLIVVSAPGRADIRYRVALAEGRSREVHAEVGEETAAPGKRRSSDEADAAPSPASLTSGGSSQQTFGYVAGGIGLAAFGFAGYSAWQAKSKDDEAQGLGCAGATCPNAEAERVSDESHDHGTAAIWSTIIGVVALGGGLVLVLTAPSEPATVSVRVAPGGMALTSTW